MSYSNDRTISKSAWLKDEECDVIARITRRVSDFTGLSMDTAEELQVVNYGIGGHYEPHFDFARLSNMSYSSDRTISKSGWLKDEECDVIARITRRVSDFTGLSMDTAEELQVVNYGIGGHYEPNFDFARLSYMAYSSDRTVSKSAWLKDEECDVIARITRRVSDFTGLSMDTAEELQVVNYGIGGHYEPHFDFARLSYMSYSSDRTTSKSAWLKDEECDVIARITRRVSDFTGLSMDTAEELQVVNYGIGGHYEPHFDFARLPNMSYSNDRTISKSAWLKDEECDVIARITRRVSDFTGLSMDTAEELQVVNYGIGGHYEPHFDFARLSMAYSNDRTISKSGWLKDEECDVIARITRRVSDFTGLSMDTAEELQVVNYGIGGHYEPHFDFARLSNMSYSIDRTISKSGWLKDEECDVIARITRRVSDFTGLSMDTAEELQVVNYGIGGHYEPNFDFARLSYMAYSSDRTVSKSAWLKDEESDVIARITRRVSDFTGLSMDTAEELQVVNYGIGGHYEPHFDFARLSNMSHSNDRTISKSAWLKDEECDVIARITRRVSDFTGLSMDTAEELQVVNYGIGGHYEPHFDFARLSNMAYSKDRTISKSGWLKDEECDVIARITRRVSDFTGLSMDTAEELQVVNYGIGGHYEPHFDFARLSNMAYSKDRTISKSGWLKDEECDVIARITRRVSDFTGLSMDTAEELQVVNYGIGGHYEPHFDFARLSTMSYSSDRTISKSAWLKDEESDVIARITRRVSDFTGLSMDTAEELQVVNYGIGGHYEPHFDFARLSNMSYSYDRTISKSAWLKDEECDVIARITRRVSDFTGLSMDTAEELQVVNYGIGGHYEPHFDFARLSNMSHSNDRTVSKSAWLKDEESDVIARITRRVSDFTGLSMDTAEELQVVNYGIGGHYEPHFDFARLSNMAYSSDRTISKSGWLKDEECDVIARITRRVSDFTGLSMDTAEELQVVNYGIGGHYEPHFDFARVSNDSCQICPSSDRTISKSAWLKDEECDVIARITRRVSDFTGLSMDTAEELQVVNYGIGGHYEPHFDFARLSNMSYSIDRTISKSGWLKDEECDVIARITRRVSDFTGLSMDTAEELQVVNYGIGGHYEPHFDFARLSMAYSNDRTISKSAWLKDEECDVIARITRRVSDFTGLSMDTAEELQVVNYGIGGHYEPHFDFARLSTMAYSSDRTVSKSGWLKDEECDVIARITRRVSDFTGLSMDTAEELQVVNYGIGGHYEPHFDFARKFENAFKERFQGNRIATVLFYMSEVAQGGATVFTELGLSVFPVKNAALYWMNLHPSGEGDISTRHAACPVLRGSKWVSNKWIHQGGQELIKPCSLEYQPEDTLRKILSPVPKSFR
ncbi:2OG-Fe(II) oxygenase superfamily domain-containing protein [Phthorimaea operculella]|nr:2OG-Fe(II) oxygenase superfamily domain-containing protein [Phthorimaea operculella]